MSASRPEFVEFVEMSGHIVDSLLLPKVLDAILSRGGQYHIEQFDIGQKQDDPSFARLQVRADSAKVLEAILREIHPHGAVPVQQADCRTVPADIDGAFPEGFYCSSNFRTQVRLGGEWIDVEDQEMDCGIVVDPEGAAARCVPMASVLKGDRVVVGRGGTRVFPPEAEIRRRDRMVWPRPRLRVELVVDDLAVESLGQILELLVQRFRTRGLAHVIRGG